MRNLILTVLVALVLATPMMAQTKGQLVGVRVTNGYHLNVFITLKGEVDVQGTDFSKITVFINDFSTRVTPEGRWALCFPKRSLYPDKKGTIVKVRALQDGTNVIAEANFDLATLNEVMDREIKFEELYPNK